MNQLLEEKYKEHKKNYEAVAIAYNISKKSYDAEYAKYAELKENLEEMFKDLEELIGKMENEEITLEQTFDLYNNGMELLKKCNLSIDEVEKKVLVLDENGETDEF